ncbi:MAG: hypothetical protein HY681_14020, partial [Chloroflexi bacterium]|nr:hypothetical protein [Chloroflexota bacterium]
QVRQVVEVMDQGQIGRRFLAEATRALQAEAGAIYLWEDGRKRLLCALGAWREGQGERTPLKVEGREVGELWIKPRLEGRQSTGKERDALDKCAASVARALALASGRGR